MFDGVFEDLCDKLIKCYFLVITLCLTEIEFLLVDFSFICLLCIPFLSSVYTYGKVLLDKFLYLFYCQGSMIIRREYIVVHVAHFCSDYF